MEKQGFECEDKDCRFGILCFHTFYAAETWTLKVADEIEED